MFMFDHRRFVADLHMQTKHLLHIWDGEICMIEDDENMHNCRWHFSLPSPAAQPFGAGHAWKRFAALTGRLWGWTAESLSFCFFLSNINLVQSSHQAAPVLTEDTHGTCWGGWNHEFHMLPLSSPHVVESLRLSRVSKILFVSFLGVLEIPKASGANITRFSLSILAPTFHPTAAFLGNLLMC